MSSIYSKLMTLRKIDSAFENWSDYRRELTCLITDKCEEGGSLLIAGAGECNDYDLNKLAEHFDKITLLDIDEKSMEEGIKKQNVSAGKFEFLKADMVGISPETCEKISLAVEEKIRKRISAGDDFLRMMEDAFAQRSIFGFDENTIWDYTVCTGVHSQLCNIFPQMAEVYSQYQNFDTERIFACCRSFNDIIAAHVNDVLIKAAGRKAIFGFELSRVGTEGRIEGAFQGMQDIVSRKAYRKEEQDLLFWPFDIRNDKAYNMCMITLKTRQ